MIRRISKLVFLGVVGAAFIISIAATWGTAQEDVLEPRSSPIVNRHWRPNPPVPTTAFSSADPLDDEGAKTLMMGVTQNGDGHGVLIGMRPTTTNEPANASAPSEDNFPDGVVAVDRKHGGLLIGITCINDHLQPIRHFLATKTDLSPTEVELKAAIDRYALSTKVESAISNLMQIVEESPQSLQGKQAKVAIDALKQSLPAPAKFDPSWPGYQNSPEGFDDPQRD